MFTDAREGEWTEFLTECVKFDAEIKEEIRIGKFTTAELDFITSLNGYVRARALRWIWEAEAVP